MASVLGLARSPEMRNHVFYFAIGAIAVTWIFMPLFKPSFGEDLSDERAIVAYLDERPEASVAALRTLVPHISTRETVMQLPTPFACPTIPIASFTGPDAAPDLVALPAGVIARPQTAADSQVVAVLQDYYERSAAFGSLEVWSRAGEVPPSVYSAVCGADAANSS